MKTYFKIIKYLQEILLIVSVIILAVLPVLIVFRPDIMTNNVIQILYNISHLSVFFVMMVRPLADIFTKVRWVRPLVILRKGAGVLSASVIVGLILSKLMVDSSGYFVSMGTSSYWSFTNYAIFAHLADISAVILVITSNNLSKRILGSWWKNIQKLSYVYFYGSVLYVYLSFGGFELLVSLILVTLVTYIAYLKNRNRILTLKTI